MLHSETLDGASKNKKKLIKRETQNIKAWRSAFFKYVRRNKHKKDKMYEE